MRPGTSAKVRLGTRWAEARTTIRSSPDDDAVGHCRFWYVDRMKNMRSVLLSTLMGGLAIHLVMVACTSSGVIEDDDAGATGVGAQGSSVSSNASSMDAVSSASAQTPTACAQWQVRIENSVLDLGGADWNAPVGWEPSATAGQTVYVRRCAD